MLKIKDLRVNFQQTKDWNNTILVYDEKNRYKFESKLPANQGLKRTIELFDVKKKNYLRVNFQQTKDWNKMGENTY